jgi:drug/metabolite transporter (DMT)-like permease
MDQRGTPRPRDGDANGSALCDVGAVEVPEPALEAMLVAGALALALAGGGALPWPPAPAPGWLLGALTLAGLFLAGNLALQYGAARLPANVTAVVMLTEVLFASVSAYALGAGTLTTSLVVGGGLIVLAAALAAFEPAR